MATEKRLIDANELLEQFQFRISPESMVSHSVYLQTISDCVDIARKIIEEAPTVDAVEVVHGRWIKRQFADDFTTAYVCSECKTTWDANSNYCPNCGAKMDGERKDNVH